MEGSLACLRPKEGEARSGSTCGQTPGKGQIGKSTFEGHAEDFELAPKSHGESLESLGAGVIGVSGLTWRGLSGFSVEGGWQNWSRSGRRANN